MSEQPVTNLSEEQQWNLFGCGSRCILYLAGIHKKPISRHAFIEKFRETFPPGGVGLTNTAGLIDMARELKISKSASSYRLRSKVMDMANKHQTTGILLLTDLPTFHCRLITDFDDTSVELFSPCQSGADYLRRHAWDDLEAELPHFLVLQ